MAGIANDVKQIRQALYGREVREAIAHGIEQCYSDVTASKTVADTAAAAANTATQNAQTATQQANQARDNAQAVADGVVNQSITAINDAAAQQRQSVNDLGDQLKSYMSEHYSETITKAEAKANRSSVSTVKHAIGADGKLTLTDALNEPAKKMTIHLEPKQDLHGYDHPWVGGAGKNLLPMTAQTQTVNNVTFTVRNDGTINVNGTATAQCNYLVGQINTALTGEYIISGCPAGGNSQNGYMQQCKLDGGWGASDVGNGTTVSISNKTFELYIIIRNGCACNNLVFKPMFRLSTVTDSTYEPYANICPIEGFDAIEVISTGKNLFKYNVTAVDKTAEYRQNSGQRLIITEESNGDLRFMFNGGGWGAAYLQLDGIDGTKDYTLSYSVVSNTTEYVPAMEKDQTLSTKDHLVVWVHASNNGTSVSSSNYFILGNIQFEEGSTATAYEPFGNKTSINLVSSAGSTVYGGTVTVNEDGSGTLVVDRAIVTLQNITSESCSYSTSTHSFYLTPNVARGMKVQPYTDAFTGVSDRFKPYPGTSTWDKVTDYVIGFGPAQNFRFTIPGLTEVADALPYINGMQVAYYLDSPSTYQLTATQLQTLLGTNHIWTDGTSIDLDYYADRYADIDKLYAALPKDTASGNPATFTDGADGLPLEKLEVAIEPKQDLHGYDRPWVEGAGKNLLDATFDSGTSYGVTFTVKKTPLGYVDYVTASGSAGSTTARWGGEVHLKAGSYILSGVPSGGSLQTYNMSIRNGLSGGVIGETDIGNGASVTIPSDGTYYIVLIVSHDSTANNIIYKPMLRLASNSNADYEPYENICPITGWDDVSINRRGKNLYSAKIGRDVFANNVGATHTSNADEMTVVMSDSTSSGIYSGVTSVIRQLISTLNGNYTISMDIKSNAARNDILFGVQGARTTLISVTTSWTRVSIAATFNGANYPFILYNNYGGTGTGGTLTIRNLMVEAGLTATNYEPYASDTLTIPIQSISGSTVYGGQLTVNRDGSGELVVDRAMATEYTFNTVTSGSTMGHYVTADNVGAKYVGSDSSLAKCNMVPIDNAGGWNQPYSTAQAGGVEGRLRVYGSFTTIQEFREQFAGLQLCYPISSPKSYTLTAPQVTTLLGTNHISCDSGQVTVTYCQDTKLILENRTDKIMSALTPYVEETMVATRNYIIGDVLSIGSALYKTTTAITRGATMTVGTNITDTTMTEAAADGLTINATPVSSLNMNSGWVNVTLDKTYAEIFSAASSAKSVVNLKYGGSNIVCRQAEYNSYSINFYGTSLDNTVLIFNVQITASSAQAAMVGSIAMTDRFMGQ